MKTSHDQNHKTSLTLKPVNMGELFNLKYTEINIGAKNITRRRDIRKAPDLINTTYLALSKKTPPQCPEQFLKWFVKSMKFLHDKPKSKFNELCYSKAIDMDIEIPDFSEPIEVKPDTGNAPMHLSQERANQFSLLESFKKSLPLHEQLIFDLYFLGGLSGYDITDQLRSEGYDIHRVRVNKWVSGIKLKMDKQIWKKQLK